MDKGRLARALAFWHWLESPIDHLGKTDKDQRLALRESNRRESERMHAHREGRKQ